MIKLTLLLFVFISGQAYAGSAHELKIVKQIYDINAKDARKMYQFSPDYLEIKKGDSVKFLGTFGRHTVHSVKGMIPAGAKKISIMPRQPNEVTFNTPGIYGIKCKLHQRHGMVALIVVGGDLHNIETARGNVKRGISPFTVEKMQALLDKAEVRFKP